MMAGTKYSHARNRLQRKRVDAGSDRPKPDLVFEGRVLLEVQGTAGAKQLASEWGLSPGAESGDIRNELGSLICSVLDIVRTTCQPTVIRNGNWELFARTMEGGRHRTVVSIDCYSPRDARVADSRRDLPFDAQDQLQIDQQLKLILANSQGFILLIDLDGTVLFSNSNFAKSFGIPLAHVAGQKLRSILDEQVFDSIIALRKRSVYKTMNGVPQNFAQSIRFPDGAVRLISVCLFPERDAGNGITGVLITGMDVTKLHRARTELHRIYRNFALSVNQFKIGIVEFDESRPDWCFADHLEVLLGLSHGSLRHSRTAVRQRIHPDDLAENRRAFDDLNAGLSTEAELRLLDAEDRYRWFRFNFSARRDLSDKNQFWSGTVADVNDLKQSQLHSQQLIHRRDQFIAILSHELRNPLLAIRHSVDLLRGSTGEVSTDIDSRRSETLDVISRQTAYISRHLDDLQDVTRCTQDQIELKNTIHDVGLSVREVLDTWRPSFENKHLELTACVPPSPLFVDADVDRFKQIFTNLLHNAYRYTDGGGHVQVQLTRAGDRIELAVSDDGLGIAADERSQIFELFYRSKAARKRDAVGMGIGLYLVQQLVEKWGGKIGVHSEGHGRGSTFRIELPAADQPLDWNGEASYLFRQASGMICLVEDFADSRLVLKSLLENRGYRVIDFEDAESASSEIPNASPDVAIIDICLPGKSGLELAAELRQSPATRNIFLIALTACGQRADIEQIYAAGFDRHLVKPSGFGDLCRLIEGRSRLERPVAEDSTCPRAVAGSSPGAGSLTS